MDIHELFQDRSERVENVELMNTFGNSVNIPFTEQDLKDFADTFQEHKTQYRPNVKVDHSTHQMLVKKLLGIDKADAELPNLGFFDNLRVVGQSLFADIVEIPKKIKEMLFNGQFKGVSPELYMDYRGTGKKFIESVALTNYPRFKHQLNLSELDDALSFSGEIYVKDEVTNMSDINTVTTEDLEKVEKNLLQKFSNIFRGKKEEHVDTDKKEFSEMQSEILYLKDALKNKDEELKKFSEAITVLSTRSKHESAKAICEKAIARGVKPSTVEHFKPLLFSALSDQKIKFSDKEGQEQEKTVVDFVVDFFGTQEGQIDFSDRTFNASERPGDPALVDHDAMMTEKGLTYLSEFKAQGLPDHEAIMKAIEKVSEE